MIYANVAHVFSCKQHVENEVGTEIIVIINICGILDLSGFIPESCGAARNGSGRRVSPSLPPLLDYQ